MPFHLHDTLTDVRIALPERTPGETSLYACGPTVYGLIHVGNARPAVIFDTLVRHLRAQGRKVTYVRNYTDVDDKIIAAAEALGEDPRALAERFVQAYREDTAALGCLVPDVEPRVSDTIPEIVQHVQALVDRGVAYTTPNGDVYYDVARFPGYGKLSRRGDLGQRGEYGRGKVGEGKRNEHDFALWKASRPTEPASVRWPSPWGEGRPGWHIECSAMAHKHLGTAFDLHGGGMDLKFPHHENEIAQSEPVHGAPFARAWMHNGFIELDVLSHADFDEATVAAVRGLLARDPDLGKISKSDRGRLEALEARAGDLNDEERALRALFARKVRFAELFLLRNLCARVDPQAVRYWILGTHYRAPLGFEVDERDGGLHLPVLEQAEKRVEYLHETYLRLAARVAQVGDRGPAGSEAKHLEQHRRAFDEALDDDLNTGATQEPVARIFERANRLCDVKKPAPGDLAAARAAMVHVSRVLGVAEASPEGFFRRVTARRLKARGLAEGSVQALVAQRESARASKDFARADALRGELTGLGIEVRDSPQGTTWRAV